MIIACGGITDPGLVAEVKLLAIVAAQDVEDDGAGGVRIAQRVAPERVISTVDPDARHGHRSRRDRYDGYKLHISVDVDSDLFVAGQATTATTGDGEVLHGLLEDDPVAVREVIGDTHYGSGEKRRDLAEAGVELTAPAQPSSAPKGYFSKDEFSIDLDAGTVTCPAGQTATIPMTKTARRRQACFDAQGVRQSARYGIAAPNEQADGSSRSTTTKNCSSPPARPAGPLSSASAIENEHGWNARTPNSNAAEPSCPGEDCERRTRGSSCAWPPSTSTTSAAWPS